MGLSKEKLAEMKEVERLAVAVTSQIGEFLDCYCLVGFDKEGHFYTAKKERGEIQRMALSRAVESLAEDRYAAECGEDQD